MKNNLLFILRCLLGEANYLGGALMLILLFGLPAGLAYHYLFKNYLAYHSYLDLQEAHHQTSGTIIDIQPINTPSWQGKQLIQLNYQFFVNHTSVKNNMYVLMNPTQQQFYPGQTVEIQYNHLISTLHGLRPFFFNDFWTFILICCVTLLMAGPAYLGLQLFLTKVALIWQRAQLHLHGRAIDAQVLHAHFINNNVLWVEYLFKEPETDEIYESKLKVYHAAPYEHLCTSGEITIFYNEANPNINCVKET